MYEYMAKVVSVYDGDTVRCDIDLGFGINMKDQKIRFMDINTPEIRGSEREEGIKVRDYVRSKILGKHVMLKTYKDSKGKYGRWLARIFYKNEGVVIASDNMSSLTCLNDELLTKGMAKEM